MEWRHLVADVNNFVQWTSDIKTEFNANHNRHPFKLPSNDNDASKCDEIINSCEYLLVFTFSG